MCDYWIYLNVVYSTDQQAMCGVYEKRTGQVCAQSPLPVCPARRKVNQILTYTCTSAKSHIYEVHEYKNKYFVTHAH